MGRWLGVWNSIWGMIRRAPMTTWSVVAFWIIGLVTGSVLRGPRPGILNQVGVGLPALADGRWWTPLTSALWAPHLASYLVVTILAFVLVAPAERRLGAWRTAAIFGISQVVGALLGVALVKLTEPLEVWPSYLADDLTVTPAIGIVGVGAALSCWLGTLWRRRLRVFLFTILIILALYVGFLGQLLPLMGAVVGLVCGLLLRGKLEEKAGHYLPSFAETRVLVAILVAVSGLGALVSIIVDNPIGPLGDYSDLLATNRPDPATVAGWCADPTLADSCREAQAEEAATAGWGELSALAPALLMLVAAEGLRRGRRLAWWIAMALKVLVIAFAVWIIADTPDDENLFSSFVPLVLPVGTIVVLLLTRRHFDRPTIGAKRIWKAILGVFLGLCALYVGIGFLARNRFSPTATFGDLILDLPARFLPPVYGLLLPVRLVPTGTVSKHLFAAIGPIFWATVLIGLLLLWWRKVPTESADDKAKARSLLESQGGSSLSYMSTWPGNQYWFNQDGTVAVPYRVEATVALTTGDPFGEPEARKAAVREFADFCAGHGWTPCLYSVTEPIRESAAELGWKSVQIAEDTVVPLAELAFTGKKWQDVRTALNKAEKEGITAEWWTYPEAPLAITDQIRAISEEWVADKGLPEMGFTLGGLAELDDPQVRCLVAIDDQRTVHGVTSWLPVYEDGQIVAWTLDFMRRRANGFRGVMEFLIASAALKFKEEGMRYLSLSGAPLARLDRGEVPDALQKLLDVMGHRLEPVYGFRSLFNFKAKFQPTYEPMYMVYPDPMALATIGTAVGRAYLPHMTAVQGVRLLRAFRTPHSSG